MSAGSRIPRSSPAACCRSRRRRCRFAELKTGTADGKAVPYETPRALETGEIPGVIDAFRQAADNALKAGFDGVEVHGANGYLIEQFLQSHTNLRTDQYGGSIENRARFLMEVTKAVVEVWGANRVGVRLSPYGVANGSGEPDPMPLYNHAVEALNPLGLAYLHFIEPRSSGAGRAEVNHQNVPSAMVLFRPIWKGVLITAGGFTGETANAAIADGHADAIAFGRIFISNPDLPRRLQHGYPLTPYNRATFYGGEAAGYTDYPDMMSWRRRRRHCERSTVVPGRCAASDHDVQLHIGAIAIPGLALTHHPGMTSGLLRRCRSSQ